MYRTDTFFRHFRQLLLTPLLRFTVVTLACSLLLIQHAGAQSEDLSKKDLARIVAVAMGTKSIPADALNPSLVDGFWELDTTEPVLGSLLIDTSGRQLNIGRIYKRQQGMLTEVTGAHSRIQLLEKMELSDFIRYLPNKDQATSSGYAPWVVVFTDVTCPYCRKMHADIGEYQALGIEVRYLPFPRYGEGSSSWDQTTSAWCAEDPEQALNDLKRSGKGGRDCTEDNSGRAEAIKRSAELAQQIGISATPTFILSDGRKIDGWVKPEILKNLLLPLIPTNPH
ncbi:MAG: DsbC family protein [Gammaproteobacteria bacterium]